MPKPKVAKVAPPRKPGGTDRTFEKARAYFRDGDYGAALAIANQILTRDPENLDALSLASGCCSLQGEYEQAAEYDHRAIDAHPDSAQAWMTFALDLQNGGRLDEAEEAYRRAVELDPSRAMAWYHLACFAARRGDTDTALENLARASAERPELREEAKSQPEFAPLLEDPRFDRIVNAKPDSEDPYADWIRSGT